MIRPLRAALVAALLPLLFPSLSHAQAALDAIVRLTPQQAASFGSAFTALSQQARVAVVAEDEPLRPTLTPQLVTGLRLKGDDEPLTTLLPRLAAAYDYDVLSSGKTFLLKKRYTDAADLPSITVKECALGLEEANRCADIFNPHFPNEEIVDSPAMKGLIYSLTPEQLEAMGDDKRGVQALSVIGLAAGEPAERAGVRVGDEIVAVNGQSTQRLAPARLTALLTALAVAPPGTLFRLSLRRGKGATGPGEALDVSWTSLDEFSAPRNVLDGLILKKANAGPWVIVSALKGCPGEQAGLQAGDEITRMAGALVAGMSPDQVQALLRHLPNPLTLTVTRKGRTAPLSVKLSAPGP